MKGLIQKDLCLLIIVDCNLLITELKSQALILANALQYHVCDKFYQALLMQH